MVSDLPKLEVPSGFKHLAPYLADFQAQFPHVDRNVFIMMPFASAYTEQIFGAVSDEVKAHGLVPLRADRRAFAPALWWNVETYMIASSYGIVIYEPNDGIPFNPNVSIEAGFMMALDRPVLLLANSQLSSMPIDFSGHIFKCFDTDNLTNSVSMSVRDWITRDLSYYNYGEKKVVLFVSVGGTCRCVMAKAILSELIAANKIASVVVEAAAICEPHKAKVSPSAVLALKDVGYEKWINGHRPRKLCRYLQDRADLIIALTGTPMARDTARGANVISDVDLFGERTFNPWPDKENDESRQKYQDARDKLKAHIEANFERILDLVEATPVI